jgi:hypothetical protein
MVMLACAPHGGQILDLFYSLHCVFALISYKVVFLGLDLLLIWFLVFTFDQFSY